MNEYSKTSAARLLTCHFDLQLIFNEVIKKSSQDFGIAQGGRSETEQLKYFLEGKSKIDPRIPSQKAKAMHLKEPSMACDIYAWDEIQKRASWDKKLLTKISKVAIPIAARLLAEGKVSHRLRWGGDWDSDGDTTDQSFNDLPHYEIVPI